MADLIWERWGATCDICGWIVGNLKDKEEARAALRKHVGEKHD